MSFNLYLQDFRKQKKTLYIIYIYISRKRLWKEGVLALIHQKITKSRDRALLEVMEVTPTHNPKRRFILLACEPMTLSIDPTQKPSYCCTSFHILNLRGKSYCHWAHFSRSDRVLQGNQWCPSLMVQERLYLGHGWDLGYREGLLNTSFLIIHADLLHFLLEEWSGLFLPAIGIEEPRLGCHLKLG